MLIGTLIVILQFAFTYVRMHSYRKVYRTKKHDTEYYYHPHLRYEFSLRSQMLKSDDFTPLGQRAIWAGYWALNLIPLQFVFVFFSWCAKFIFPFLQHKLFKEQPVPEKYLWRP